jgi:hypothetical protein
VNVQKRSTAETRVEVGGRPHVEVGVEPEAEAHSQLERFKVAPHRESPAVLHSLLDRLETINGLGFTDWPPLVGVRPAAVGCWLVGDRYDVWSLRRLQSPKRYAVLHGVLQFGVRGADKVVSVMLLVAITHNLLRWMALFT